MRQTRTSGSMSGDGKRADAATRLVDTAPVLDSTVNRITNVHERGSVLTTKHHVQLPRNS